MSRYPSSAELHEYRHSFPCIPCREAVGQHHPAIGCAVLHPAGPGATDAERSGGIGYRYGRPDFPLILSDGWMTYATGSQQQDQSDHCTARREASALRSRTYARMDYCACQHPDRHYGNQPCRVTPASAGIPLGPNGYCWSCWSAKHDQPIPTDTWTEDEPRHPLPIRYQPSFTIG